MTGSRDLRVSCIVTAGAGFVGIPADGCTGSRLCGMLYLVVTESGKLIRLNVIATGAISLHFSHNGTSRRCCLIPFTHIVTKLVHITVHVAVATVADMGGMATVCAGGSHNSRFIMMDMPLRRKFTIFGHGHSWYISVPPF